MMRYICLLFVATFFVSPALCQSRLSYDVKDLAALNELPVKWQQYWNRHDMDSMGTLLREDVDFVNVAGNWLKGKKNTVQDHKEKHQGFRFSKSIWQTDSVSIKFISKDLALIHLSWGLSGDYENEATLRPPHQGIFTWLVFRQDNKWLVLAAQNTNKK